MRFLTTTILFFLLTANFSLMFSQVVETITSSFNASGGVAIDDSGTVYVADFGQFLNQGTGSKVYKVYDDGTITEFASGLIGASGNDFDSHGNLFQSNIGGNRLSKITPDGTVTTFARNGITAPVGVAVGEGDTVYVANCGSNSIARVTPDGNSSVWVTSDLFQCPNGLTLDDDGNLYTCNFGSGDIIKITPNKEVSVLATLPGGRCGHLTYFEGILYAVARCASKIYEVTLEGDTTLIAGTGVRGNNDGPGNIATFNFPNGIRAKRDDDNIILYINDAVSLNGDCLSTPLNPIIVRKITISPTAVNKDESSIPADFKLYQNYPNPFNPTTKIRYTIAPQNLPRDGASVGTSFMKFVKLKVYDVLGNEIATLVNEEKSAGSYEVEFNGSHLSSGIYYYQIRTGSFIDTKKFVLMK